MNGNTQITLSDGKVKKVGRSTRSTHNLFFYSGYFSSGNKGGVGREVSVLAYDSEHQAKSLHNQLTRFDHPNVMRSLGYAKGVGKYSMYTFVALPVIRGTLGEWLEPGSGAAEMGRFTEQFIGVLRYVITATKCIV